MTLLVLNSILPPPKHNYASYPKEAQQKTISLSNVNSKVPPFGQRKGWTPRKAEDFGDGGAFPEIHVVQYPLDMGRQKSETSSVIPLTFDSNGKIKFDSVLGRTDKKVVYSSSKDLVAFKPEVERTRPTEEEEIETTQRTKQALEKILNGKITASHPSKPAENNREITYFQYTPTADGSTPNAGSKQRIVKLVEMAQDPLEPPKFKHKKVARGPGSPPVPILHSPPRKLTQQDVEDWNIPSCISSWKNQKGYTISLDKRLAADGRGLQKPQINDKFAVFSESLYLAERNAREMVESRLQIKEKLLQQQRKQKEEAIIELAKNTRLERSKISAEDEDEDEIDEKVERDRLRDERRKQTEREMRLENFSSKKKKRDEDRDVSEAIALGKAVPKTTTGEGMFDQRLFNQTQGMSQGFGAEDSYNVYDKPLFHGSAATQLFRPKKSEIDPYAGEDDLDKLKQGTSKFRPDKGFAGTESDKPIQPRSKPVQFEKDDFTNDEEEYEDNRRGNNKADEDEFGLDEFLDVAKKSKGNVILPSDRRNTLHASSTTSVSSDNSSHSSRNIQFTSSNTSAQSNPQAHKSFEAKNATNYKLSDKNMNNNRDDSQSPPRRTSKRSRSPSPDRRRNVDRDSDRRNVDRNSDRDRNRDRDSDRGRDKYSDYDRDRNKNSKNDRDDKYRDSDRRRDRDDDRKRRKYD